VAVAAGWRVWRWQVSINLDAASFIVPQSKVKIARHRSGGPQSPAAVLFVKRTKNTGSFSEKEPKTTSLLEK
jgi:hypothetical protein